MFCIRCGAILPDGSRSCLNCGMLMEAEYVSAMTRQEAIPMISYGSSQSGKAYRPTKKKFVLPIGFPVLFGILALASVLFFVGIIWLLRSQQIPYEASAATEWENYAPLEEQEEILDSELQGEVFAPEVPEIPEIPEVPEVSGEEQSGLYWLMHAPYPYIIADSNSRYLDYYELYAYTKDELYYAYFEIWARAGVDMSFDVNLENYFSTREWYHPVYTFDDPLWEILNDYEMTNMETIGLFLDTEFNDDWQDEDWDDNDYPEYDTGGSVSGLNNGSQSGNLNMW